MAGPQQPFARTCLAPHFFCEMFFRARAAGLVEDGRFALPLTQEFVADAPGLTPVHVNRTLKSLRETGTVEWRSGQLNVHDWAMLAETGDFDAGLSPSEALTSRAA